MIKKLEVSGVHMKLDVKLTKYATKKIGHLDKYLPRHARDSAHAEVILKESKLKTRKECTCEVVLHLPKGKITTKESTMNMFASIDVVEAKLKNQLKKYKETHSSLRLHRRVISRIKRAKMASSSLDNL